ncbi:lipoate--protein ligase [Marseilla massiliensis]|uniref:lipoate--protein ligase n=1 Tax=Marseilla massiliensis TaxID=1841864 RepID=A0A939B8D9_9BACT|nr:lipoate--protein ligase [Marseilla massiliensis]MBM6674726.1 lipoyltransferase [Marseilla massiliensis]
MLYVALPEEKIRKVSFYLAMEEFVARNVTADDCLFYWQVEPSVVFGRNQLVSNEVNVDYCRSHGIGMFRRKSGGGCVYADNDNVMFSFITGGDNVGLTFNRYMQMMVLMLRRMGVEATADGRNDILIEGRKVSGTAFYHIPGRNIVHGTMLFDTDMDNMTRSITPPGEKLASNGVDSVRRRVALLKDYIDVSIDDFKADIRRTLCDGEHVLTQADVEEIERIEREVYLSPDFIYGNNPRHTLTRRRRIDGVGELEALIDVKGTVIKSVTLNGDFFVTGDVDGGLLACLNNVVLTREAVALALPDHTEDYIMNLRKEDFVDLLCGDGD